MSERQIARLYVDGVETASMPVPSTGLTMEMFNVEFSTGAHRITVTVGTKES